MAHIEPEIADWVRQIEAIKQDARSLAGGLDEEAFNWQPGPGQWSVGQCLEHLNITHQAMLPRMEDAGGRVRADDRRARGATRHGFFMRWMIKDMEPPAKRRYRTGPGFVPLSALQREPVLAEFIRLHDGLLSLLEQVNGYDLSAVKVQSPFAKWLRYRLGSGMALQMAHDRRHLWQARQVAEAHQRQKRK